jgi:hypothetical protein
VLKINKIKKIMFSCIVLVYSGPESAHNRGASPVLLGSPRNRPHAAQENVLLHDEANGVVFPKSSLVAIYSTAIKAMKQINHFASALNMFLWNEVMAKDEGIIQRILRSQPRSLYENYRLEETRDYAIGKILCLIHKQYPQIIPEIIQEKSSEILPELCRIVKIEPTTPFTIDEEFLTLLGLLKSVFLGRYPRAQTLLQYFELNPEILYVFNKFYQSIDKDHLNPWIEALGSLEKHPTVPNICTSPNTSNNALSLGLQTKGLLNEEAIQFATQFFASRGHTLRIVEGHDWLKNQALFEQYKDFKESQDHTYTLEELFELHKFIIWLRHRESITEDQAIKDGITKWLHLAENPGKFCQFFVSRAVRIKKDASTASAATA